jgi:hypothetical protein
MKSISIGDKYINYERLDIQTSLLTHVTIHLTLDKNKIDQDFIYEKYDNQVKYSKAADYKFDIKHSLGSFYGCLISKMEIDSNKIYLEIKSDYNNAKPLKQHRIDIIEDILSTTDDDSNINTNNNN